MIISSGHTAYVIKTIGMHGMIYLTIEKWFANSFTLNIIRRCAQNILPSQMQAHGRNCKGRPTTVTLRRRAAKDHAKMVIFTLVFTLNY